MSLPNQSPSGSAAAADAPRWDLPSILARLRSERERWRTQQRRSHEFGGRELPSRDTLRLLVESLRSALFPMRLGPPDLRQESEDYYIGHTLDAALDALLGQIRLELHYGARLAPPPEDELQRQAIGIVRDFAERLPEIRRLLDSDVQAAFDGDPAAHSVDEILLCYPGIMAMINHRLAHELYKLGAPLVARVISELAHAQTGIDIHPGAQIGPSFFIDHGTGVVIGETAVIGERVRIYQAVTLGAKHFPLDEHGHLRKGLPRHPVVEDDVVIYAGTTILGRVTIGHGSTIGGNLWLTRDVAPGSRLTQASSRHEPPDPSPQH